MRLYGSANIVKYGNQLFSWVTTTDTTSPSTKATVLRLTIGQSVKDMEVVLRDVDVDFLRFNARGLPTCAEFKLTLVQQDRSKPMLNPTSGGRWANRTHTVAAGDSLQWIAQSNYRSPGAWRMVAEENGIDDPLRVRAGNVLLLPRTAD
jgi:LysM repeat protein